EQTQVEDLEVVHDLAELVADRGRPIFRARMEKIRAGALDDELERRDRGGNLIARESCEEDAESVGIDLDRAIRAHHLVGRPGRRPATRTSLSKIARTRTVVGWSAPGVPYCSP